ncbi:MAG: RluA family pseudouridine synthase [Planctomycetota bacterium]
METLFLEVDRPAEDLVAFLAEALPDVPLGAIRRLVARGRVEVDGRRVGHQWQPQPGQHIAVRLPEEPIVRFAPEPVEFDVLHETAHLLAINKPAGLSVVPDPCSRECRLINGLLHYVRHESPSPCQRVYLVHRLDRGTSGVLLAAKDAATARHLSERFERREVTKLYLAVVGGEVAASGGAVDRKIAQGTRGRMRLRDRRGKPARSHWRVVERFRGFTLVEVRPVTGRQHQVRLHLSALGHPLAVDPLYGGAEAVFLSEFKRDYRPSRRRPESPLVDRLTLHAHRLELPLADGSPLAVEAPLPDDLDRLLGALRKYAAP